MADRDAYPVNIEVSQTPELPKEVDKGGRPTVMTPEIIDELRKAFMFGATDAQACAFAKISRQTLYNYQTENPEFIDQKEEWKEHPILKAKVTVYNKLNEPETAKWYLERKAKEEFGTRQEITGPNGAYLIPLIKKLDKTDYEQSGVVEEARKQMVALDPSLQDKGQVGEHSGVQAELSAGQTPDGTGESQTQPDPQV